MVVAGDILQLIGNTPLLELNKLRKNNMARIVVKLEFLNPGGSVKSRTALAMVEDAERSGLIHQDSIIVEPSTGNQGIALAMVAAVKGYRVKIIMPESVSQERRKLIRHFGGEVVLIKDGANIQDTVQQCMNKAQELQEKDQHVFLTRQFENPANPLVHYRVTADEIIRQIDSPIDAFCAGFGTGGCLNGIGQHIKEVFPQCSIIAVEPENAAILSGGSMGQHIQQGIGDGVISSFFDTALIDDTITVSDEEALQMARKLASVEGLLVGVSSGTNAFAAEKVAERLGPGKTVVTLMPDTAERYYSTALFDHGGL